MTGKRIVVKVGTSTYDSLKEKIEQTIVIPRKKDDEEKKENKDGDKEEKKENEKETEGQGSNA